MRLRCDPLRTTYRPIWHWGRIVIRLLHTADIHLDSPLKSLALRDPELRQTVEAATRAALMRIIDLALSEQVTALLIAGDLFDGNARSASTAAFLTQQLERLQHAGIRVFYIKGNHDAENPITGALDLPENVHTFDARGGKVQLSDDLWIHGVSFADRHAPESLLPRFSAPVAGAVNIAMLHSSLAGAAGHDVYAPCALSELTEAGFDYWALGHVHKRHVHSSSPWVVMPGMPQGRDIGEAGPKSVSLISVENGSIEVQERATSVLEFVTSDLDISAVDSSDGLRLMLRAHLTDLRNTVTAQAGVVRLTLTGTPLNHWQILRDREFWAEQVAQLTREAGALWLDKLVLDFAPAQASTETSSAVQELSELMVEIQAELGFAALAEDEIDKVMQDLPQSIRERVLPTQEHRDALLRRLAADGADSVLAQMKGADS